MAPNLPSIPDLWQGPWKNHSLVPLLSFQNSWQRHHKCLQANKHQPGELEIFKMVDRQHLVNYFVCTEFSNLFQGIYCFFHDVSTQPLKPENLWEKTSIRDTIIIYNIINWSSNKNKKKCLAKSFLITKSIIR